MLDYDLFVALLAQEEDTNSSFKELLLQHVDLAHGAGFDDSIGRNSSAGIFNVSLMRWGCTWLGTALMLKLVLPKMETGQQALLRIALQWVILIIYKISLT